VIVVTQSYPSDLARFVCKRWTECGAPKAGELGALPEVSKVERLLSVVYQASLLKEEDRQVTFRLILGEPAAFPEEGGPPAGFHRLVFTQPRNFDQHELARLSPAAKYHRALIGVLEDPELGFVIWGIVQSGARWLRDTHGGRTSQSQVLPSELVISVTGPGRLAVARGVETLGELREGVISRPSMDVFQARWLGERFAEIREEREILHAEQRAGAREAWAPLDPDIIGVIAQQMFKRVIFTMRMTHHGGLLLILPPEYAAGAARAAVLRSKYAFEQGESRRRYRTLIMRLMNALAEEGGRSSPVPESVGWSQYETSTSPTIADLDEAIFELSHLIAGLADVDGAVVMTKRFELLGFGAEIRGSDLPDVITVQRALDLEATRCEMEPTDGVGTRHRAAYRLCQHVRDALAVVASQDGSIRFVTWMNDAVTYWDHVSSAAPGA
jgi:hypothetical protein